MFNFPDINTELLFNFLVVTALSLILGLEQRRHHKEQDEEHDTLLGTDRTFTFLGILGFILYILDDEKLRLFAGGGLIVSVLMAIYYHNKIKIRKKSGLTSILSALITYCLAPILFTQPQWLTFTIVVMVLILIEMKEAFFEISSKFGKDEFIILAKFILMAVIILPNLPDNPIIESIPLSPYKLWLSLVISSGISYISYLLKKFVFTRSGILVSGLLGGLYSSTAVALILSKKSQDHPDWYHDYAAAILLATGIMYIRILLVTLFLNVSICLMLLPYLLFFVLIIMGIALIIKRKGRVKQLDVNSTHEQHSNPLELKVALFFSLMYMLFIFLGHYAELYFGAKGLHFLSFLAGFADVDSYIMSLLQGKYAITPLFISTSIIVTSTANNIIKTIYSLFFAEKNAKKIILAGFSFVISVNLLVLVYLFFISS